jgi:hypothetical protein
VSQRFVEAYLAVRAASKSHGEVGYLVDLLNHALADYEAGAEPDIILAQLDEVVEFADEETARSVETHNRLLWVTGVQLAFVGALIYVSWGHLPRLFWRRWLKVRGSWRVECADR